MAEKKESANQAQKDTNPDAYKPTKAELKANINMATSPDALLEAVFGYNPRKK